jgi:hypothetical protein
MTSRNDRVAARRPEGLSGQQEVEIALLDCGGVIVQTNAVWDEFCLSNGG